MSNKAMTNMVQADKEAKEQKIKDLKASISIATNTIRIVENAEMKGRDSFVVIDSLSWLHTIKQSLDLELEKIDPKKKDEGSPAGKPEDAKNPAPPTETPAPSESPLEVVK